MMNKRGRRIAHLNMLLVIGTLLGALVVIGCRLVSRRLRLAVDVLAVVSLCGFEMISAIAVTDIIRHD
ncbi:MAG: hypothetical protein K0Q59_5537, partial [Paenibacillus sp.]|nr:hypothetical protein [Paenibacillus sp.]